MTEEYKPTPRQKVTVREDISYQLDGLYLTDAALQMQNLADIHPGGILEYGDYDKYESQYRLFLVTQRDETDSEMWCRHGKEKEDFVRRQQRDIAEFERLKKKFRKK